MENQLDCIRIFLQEAGITDSGPYNGMELPAIVQALLVAAEITPERMNLGHDDLQRFILRASRGGSSACILGKALWPLLNEAAYADIIHRESGVSLTRYERLAWEANERMLHEEAQRQETERAAAGAAKIAASKARSAKNSRAYVARKTPDEFIAYRDGRTERARERRESLPTDEREAFKAADAARARQYRADMPPDEKAEAAALRAQREEQRALTETSGEHRARLDGRNATQQVRRGRRTEEEHTQNNAAEAQRMANKRAAETPEARLLRLSKQRIINQRNRDRKSGNPQTVAGKTHER